MVYLIACLRFELVSLIQKGMGRGKNLALFVVFSKRLLVCGFRLDSKKKFPSSCFCGRSPVHQHEHQNKPDEKRPIQLQLQNRNYYQEIKDFTIFRYI